MHNGYHGTETCKEPSESWEDSAEAKSMLEDMEKESRISIAALYVETDGCYFGLDDVDPWDQARDARLYAGPHPVVAHPPCQRWGRFWHGSTRKPHQFKLGDDGGCFAAALAALCQWGGVLEHPADSHAWDVFGIQKPKRGMGWLNVSFPMQHLHFNAHGQSAWTCYVEQGQYGHFSRKGTWLLYVGCRKPYDLDWTIGDQRIDPRALAKHGYEKARRIGMMAMVGGKDKTRIRNATPPAFRDLLIDLAKISRFTEHPELPHKEMTGAEPEA